MNNDWLDDLRMKMEDHTEDVPDGLWDDINNELFHKEEENRAVGLVVGSDAAKANVKKEVSAFKLKSLYRTVGVAAVIALFFVVGNQIFDHFTGNKSSEHVRTGEKNTVQSFENQIDLKSDEAQGKRDLYQKNTVQHIGSQEAGYTDAFSKKVSKKGSEDLKNFDSHIVRDDSSEGIASLPHKNEDTEQKQNTVIDNENLNDKKGFTELLSNNEIKNKTAETEKIKKRTSRKFWMVSMLAGNAASSAQQIPGYATISGAPMKVDEIYQSSGTEENPLVAVLVANQDKNVDAKFVHKMPFTLGASVYHSLGKKRKWGIGTGVNYTKLSSEVRSGSQSNFIKSEQTIHYIGIPVQVNYNVIQKGKFTGYVTGGAMIEKAVAADLRTKYVVNDVVKENTTEKIEEKPFQFSVNSAVGVQYKIISKVGLYAEPGVGYHFKDNSSLNTIYKEKPLNFNVKFGIRILID